MDAMEAAARALYECERQRANHCDAVLSRAFGKPVKDHMEPWDECKEFYLGDARAALDAATEAMGWPEINAFKAEIHKGQSIFEDAGGYWMRALRRLFGLPAQDEEVINYQRAAKAMVDAATPMGSDMKLDQSKLRWDIFSDASMRPTKRYRLTDLDSGIVIEGEEIPYGQSVQAERNRMLDRLIEARAATVVGS
jgi:hypothetical protein